MNATTALSRDLLLPRPPDKTGRGALLAFIAHVLLVLAIAFSVRWRASEPPGIEAELWAAVPQAAAPRAVEPEPAQPKPEPKPLPPPPKPAPAPEPRVDAQIAIEKAKAEKERARLDEEKQRKEELKRAEAQREKDEADRKRKEAADKQKRDAAQAAALEAEREKNLQRILGQAGATGAPNATGTAQRSAGPSATYAGRIKARVMPNITFTDTVPGNPLASVEVKAGPDGTIIGRRLVKSSGVPAWDEAVLRAIDKTEVLPRDTDGTVPSPIIIDFRARE